MQVIPPIEFLLPAKMTSTDDTYGYGLHPPHPTTHSEFIWSSLECPTHLLFLVLLKSSECWFHFFKDTPVKVMDFPQFSPYSSNIDLAFIMGQGLY